MKAVLVIADGMADRPLKELGWKTPLEMAKRASLNRLARSGICGIMDVLSPGVTPGSDAATLALLGYDALKVYSGRGALEAIGSGMDVQPGNVAFRCNFGTINASRIVVDRRAGRIETEDASKLAESLQVIKLGEESDIEVSFANTIQHRAVLVVRGRGLSSAVGDSDPGKAGEMISAVRPVDESDEARFTAGILNELLEKYEKILKEHPVNRKRAERGFSPANVVLCRGAGTVPNIETLSERFHIRGSCIAAAPLARGVSKVAGLDLVDVAGATGTPESNFNAKAKSASEVLKLQDFVLLHVKGTDVAGHDRNVEQKIRLIEKLDAMLGYLLAEIDLDTTYVAVTADHTTSCLTGNHEGDPVPLAVGGPHVRRDDVQNFGERTCAKGGLNRMCGLDLMPTLMNLIGKTRKFGA